jgi:hypothetical protein
LHTGEAAPGRPDKFAVAHDGNRNAGYVFQPADRVDALRRAGNGGNVIRSRMAR